MRKVIGKQIIAGLLFATAGGLFFLTQSTVRTNASQPLRDGREHVSAVWTKQTSGAQPPQNPFIVELQKKIAGQENKPAEEVFKNIQILKGMPAGRILRVMEVAFNNSLGVDCTHCHIPEQWEKDDKEAKQTARKMWQFTGKVNQDLKEAIGKGQINCTTCHRGQVKPAMSMPSPK